MNLSEVKLVFERKSNWYLKGSQTGILTEVILVFERRSNWYLNGSQTDYLKFNHYEKKKNKIPLIFESIRF